ncbi:hypothetical protein [Spiroplasma endosymbiont of Danaus chrysippus]|uniref:hypothetical protein n=1 Tax=Spiroplasma endosymbiont of Danaus chrysippus TaxID=2691041 RepID=UPI00157B987F|nr:hypothetical protein [Spiroplasma endosymbiont of Danaus chrysippus]
MKLKKIHQKNIIGTIVDIDTSGIKTDIDNSLWEVDKDNINFVKLKDDKGIDVNGKRIIDVGTPTFLSDATTKEYVDKKQDKLIAGENIKIDEKTNTISASGGSGQSLWETDPNSPNIIQPKEKRLITANNKRIVYIADPQQPQDAVNKRYVDKNLENKMDKENWKIIGESINNREYNNFKLWFDKLYRVLIIWEKPPFNQVNTRIILEFKTGKYLGGKAGDKIFLTQGEIDGIEANLYLVVVNANNFKLIIEGGNEKYGNIFSLEELQNTIKVNILPLNIISKTLNIKLLEKDAFNIELKDIPPTPSPSGSNWKEVGTKVNINHIKYTFKSNTKYKIYYNFESQSSNKKFAFMSKEFLYGELNTDVQTLYWDKVNERIIISLQMQNDTIAVVSNPTRYGQLLKLEELQE